MNSPASTPGLWRRFTAAYAKFLTGLLALSVAVIIIPVTLQMISRYTALIPAYIWTEEMARFLFIWMIMIGFAMVFLIGGIEFTRFAWYRTSELADLPLWMIHIAWPVAAVTWIVFLGEQFYDETRILFGRSAT